jgi:multicomponent Na+:H+ antiporter subunit D
MVAVILVRAAGGDTIEALAGSATRRPVAVFAFGLAAVSLVGLPPTGGFVAKWYLLVASLETGQWWWIPVIVVSTLLTAAYLMRIVKRALAPPPAGVSTTREWGWADVIALLLALTTLLLGLRPADVLALLEVGSPLHGPGG